MATVEAAIALATLVSVLVLCVGALLAVSAQVRCVDAAREAARLAARGDSAAADSVARQVAPAGALITIRTEDALVTAVVTARTPVFPLTLHAAAVAAREPGAAR